jgi:replication factor C small subunit
MTLSNNFWTEKYRPSTFDELVSIPKGLRELVEKVRSEGSKMPSLLFFSDSAGTGKTTSAMIIAKYLDCDYIKLNSSDERGIDTIRDTVKTFAQTMSSNDNQKCIIFDEADGQTKASQEALKGLIETYHSNCFFIFTCNDYSKILDPIISRCMVFKFGTPSKESIKERLSYICNAENLKIEENFLDRLVSSCYPDIRSMVKTLQKTAVFGASDLSSDKDFLDMVQTLKAHDLNSIYSAVWSGSFDMSRFTKWMIRYVFEHRKDFNDIAISNIVYQLSEIEKSFCLGANREIVFTNALIKISELL